MTMLQRVVVSLTSMWLIFMATPLVAQPPPDNSTGPVLDTSGRPITRGVKYYIKHAVTGNGGRLTLVGRNGSSCPLFVGQERVSGAKGLPVTFRPFVRSETVIRENRDFQVTFQASSICQQSTQWVVGETAANRRLIAAGEGDRFGGFFRIEKNNGVYNIVWCPTDVCPFCRFRCGSGGILMENGVRLLALDGPVLPIVFERA